MSERQKQTQFLRELIRSHDSDHCRELQVRIANAEQNERCVGSAVRLAFLLGLLAALGLGYSAVLVPEFFQSTTPVAVQIFSALLLTSGICFFSFVWLSCWYRSASNAIYNEGRTFIISQQKSAAFAPAPLPTTKAVSAEGPHGAFATVPLT